MLDRRRLALASRGRRLLGLIDQHPDARHHVSRIDKDQRCAEPVDQQARRRPNRQSGCVTGWRETESLARVRRKMFAGPSPASARLGHTPHHGNRALAGTINFTFSEKIFVESENIFLAT